MDKPIVRIQEFDNSTTIYIKHGKCWTDTYTIWPDDMSQLFSMLDDLGYVVDYERSFDV